MKTAEAVKSETLFDVDYTLTLNGFVVIAADSPEQAKLIVEDPINFPALFQGSGAFRPAAVTKIEVSTKAGETSDNIGAVITAIPRVLNQK